MAKRTPKPSLPDETRHELVKEFQQELLKIADPVERQVLRDDFTKKLKQYDITNPAKLVKAAEQAIGNVSEADRAPVQGDPLNSIRALPDNPPTLEITKALLLVEAALAGAVLDERIVLAHRRTVLQLLKARHVNASELVDRTFKPLLTKSRALPVSSNHTRTTDQAFAEELSVRAGGSIKYRPGVKSGVWYVYDAGHWAISDGGSVIPLVTSMARERYKKAAESNSTDERIRLSKEATHLESLKVAQNIVGMASTLPELRALGDEFDRDPYLLNVQNGTIDLRTGELRPHRREDLLTKIIPIEYAPDTACPVFEAFLQTIFDGNVEEIAYVQRAAGYSLTAEISEQVMFIAIGTGANGKTTFLNALQSAMGPYAVKMSAATLLQQKNGGDVARNDIATLEGCRLAACAESGLGRRMNEEWVKEITGGEKIKAKRLYLDVFEVDPTWKIWLATNHKPVVRGTDHAIWRRLKVIPFNVTIPTEAQDKQLPDKLRAELPGILAWMVKGCLDWQRYGLMEPRMIGKAASDYRDEMDFVAAFLDECCVIGEGHRATFDVLYKRYLRWAKESHEPELSKKLLGSRLAEKGFRAIRTDKARGWDGLRVATPGEKDRLPERADVDDKDSIDESEMAEVLERCFDPRDEGRDDE